MDGFLGGGIADLLRRNDPRAVESLVAVFHRPIYRFLVCRGADPVLAEELTAETFYQLIRSFRRFRGGDGQVRAFVYATARHVRSRHLRRNSRIEHSQEATESAMDQSDSPLQTLLGTERAEEVAAAVAQLSDVMREVLILRFVEDFSIQEISSTCGLPAGTVKSRLHRAKHELKRKLSEAESPR
ncbi:MAG: RNA polymerase sigma factor [Planctomycetota bacterium]